MKIIIETIPHKEQQYETCGNYWTDSDGTIQIRVSDMGNNIYEKLVAIHEVVECILTDYKGITEKEITDFDVEFENNRKDGDVSEPGFSKYAPYKNEHAIATAVELMMCAHMGISWQDYEKSINSL
jgi:hypothetical protein